MSTEATGRVVCGGWACWDVRLRVADFPPRHARTEVTSRREDAGGPATVAAMAAASVGTSALLVTHLGHDSYGARLQDRLAVTGVQLGLPATAGFQTPVNTILVVPDGERFIFREAQSEPATSLPLLNLTRHDVVLLDCRAPHLAKQLAEQARTVGARVILDFDRDEPAAWELAHLSTHIIADEAVTQHLGGLDALLTQLPRAEVVAATLGPRGVWTQTAVIPACQVPVLDTTGAGDVFHGAYAAALLHEHPSPLHFAAAAAAVRCATGELPTDASTTTLMEKNYDSAETYAR
ncbi:PfkB family carbohydrate kinase [Deinococcus peraridilitoris]|uniref:PfkB family carbohydrate kinase n=1 Tax=Deinococcus peraridilitoris TaxID=432329 RepID=UPI0012FBB7BF|nr:PfkB family carbohydrate kinase [Deinococcus peraridilitoris]